MAWWTAHGHSREKLHDLDLVLEAVRFSVRIAARPGERAGASPPRLHQLTAEDAAMLA